ncbi:MAG: NUDIX hydrolase [candidate division WOR-3 bacterium]|nr:NUDIX hydrolase [candidate division WOR-3 bacterium]
MKQPRLTVDIIIEYQGKIVLIKRNNPPWGWALPGGFVEYGETVESAAVRESKEETGLDLLELNQFHTYSDPTRDPRGHTVSVVFTAKGAGVLKAGDDAKDIGLFSLEDLPPLAFDHQKILQDYAETKFKKSDKC